MNEDDGGLLELLADTISATNDILVGFKGRPIPDGDLGHLWRWAFIYLVLAADLGSSALELANGQNNRALLILRRCMFEHMVRFRFYRSRPEIARGRLFDFTKDIEKFQKRLGDEAFHVISDPTADHSTHKPDGMNFEQILRAVFPKNCDRLYAQFYSFPSALMHGTAMASVDIIEDTGDGQFRIHAVSRRGDTARDILFNYVSFYRALLEDASDVLNLDSAAIRALRERQGETLAALGIEVDHG